MRKTSAAERLQNNPVPTRAGSIRPLSLRAAAGPGQRCDRECPHRGPAALAAATSTAEPDRIGQSGRVHHQQLDGAGRRLGEQLPDPAPEAAVGGDRPGGVRGRHGQPRRHLHGHQHGVTHPLRLPGEGPERRRPERMVQLREDRQDEPRLRRAPTMLAVADRPNHS